jgi:hypothetical protein
MDFMLTIRIRGTGKILVNGSRLSVHGEGLILVNGSRLMVNCSWLGRRKR